MERPEPLPTISVIIPCYNASQYLAETIASVLAQDYHALEVIVVDDGSHDGSTAIVSNLNDSRIRLLEQQNEGAAAARNRGFAASCGDAVLFLDADDVICDRHLSSLQRALAGSSQDVAFGRWDRFSDQLSEATFPDRSYYQCMPAIEWLMLNWESSAPMTQCGSFLIPRQLIKRAGGWDESLTLIDDFEFFARLLSQTEQMRFAPESKLFYRSNITGSLSGSRGRRAAESQLRAIRLGTDYVLATSNTATNRRACANRFAEFRFEHYPNYPDLCEEAWARLMDLGGASAEPKGPPMFHALRKFTGWKLARRAQGLSDYFRVR